MDGQKYRENYKSISLQEMEDIEMAEGVHPSRRLMIKEMVLENFKSYAGAQRVGPFDKSFSAVVGPNGSGKSNVIDAMLFVFGRRAKQLRFNKISELIHNSSNHRNCETARVTVHFQEIIDQEGDGFEVVPGSEFSVARTAHRNNQSDYYLNDRRVPAKDVVDTLKNKGIDLDNNRFLILQGEVEQISMMKPKAEDKNDTGLLEYLEDIIGTDQYVQPIEDLGKRLDEVNEKRQGMLQRLKIAEKEKDGLESKKQEAEDFLNKQMQMIKHKINSAQLNKNLLQESLNENTKKREDLEAKLKYEREKHQSYDRDSKEQDKKFLAVEKQHQALINALETAQEKFKEFERKDAQLQMDIKHAKQKLKKTDTKIDTDVSNIKKLEADISSIELDMPRSRAHIEKLSMEISQQEALLESMLEGIKDEVEAYHRQLSEVRTELAPWEKRISEISSRSGVLTTERDMLMKRSEDAKRRLEAALKGLEAAQKSAQAKSKQIQELEQAAGRCRQQITQHQADLQAQRTEEAKLEIRVKEVRERAATLRADANAVQQQSGLVSALLAAKAKGEVSGVYGRLGDLGAIDKQYDIAVSTAVGALDFIVVETASDAQKCVEYLRRSQLGVATFLILEKQQHLAAQAASKLKTPEGAPRLYDLIKVKDETLRPAFYFAMGNTVVASDLEQATRIAYGNDTRFRRVVTIQGQLIAESGTMSGGGGRPSRGRMLLGSSAPKGNVDAKAVQAELRQAEHEMETVTEALKSIRDQVAACEQALKAAEKQLGDLETAVPKARMEAETEVAKAHDIQQRLDELRAATEVSADDVRSINELDKSIRQEEEALSELKVQTAGLEKKAAVLQQKIDDAGGDKLKKQKSLITKLQKENNEAEADSTRKVVQIKASKKSVEKLKKETTKDAEEKAKLSVEIIKLEESVKTMENDALAAMEDVQERTVAVESSKEGLEIAKSTRDKFQLDFGIVQRTQVAIESQIDEISKYVNREMQNMGQRDKEMAGLLSQLQKVTGAQEELPCLEELQGLDASDEMYKAGMLEAEMQKMNPDMEAIEQYRLKEADYNAKMTDLEGITSERDQVRSSHEGLRKRRLDEFMSAFKIITTKLKEMYQMITLGGDAELELVDSCDPFSEGVNFSVRPPRKSWKKIGNLSGGEKTLSSLALVFALHHFKPTPLYVMDEIDAALDFKNVSIVGHYLKDRTKNAQFIIISLRNNMFELADRLVGIYKTENATKTIAINPAEFTLPTLPDQEQEPPGQDTVAATAVAVTVV